MMVEDSKPKVTFTFNVSAEGLSTVEVASYDLAETLKLLYKATGLRVFTIGVVVEHAP